MPGYHYKARAHSSYGCIDVLKQANPQELWMNPLDASERSIKDGDKVQVFNDRGTVEIVAKVTPAHHARRGVDGPGSLARRRHVRKQGGQGRLHQHADLSSPDAFGEG